MGAILVVNATDEPEALAHSRRRKDRGRLFSRRRAARRRGRRSPGIHGGRGSGIPVRIDDEVVAELERLTELAPLHNAPAVEALAQARAVLSACLTSPSSTRRFTQRSRRRRRATRCSQAWREQWGIRRYGFHGLSVQWASEQVPVSRLVVCHLGAELGDGRADGRSVETTMGFSPLEGVPMATSVRVDRLRNRPLSLRHELVSAEMVEEALEHRSGPLGLSVSARVEELEGSDDPRARLALNVFAYLRPAPWPPARSRSAGSTRSSSQQAWAKARTRSRRRVRPSAVARRGVGRRCKCGRHDHGGLERRRVGGGVLVVHAREDLTAARAARELLGPSGAAYSNLAVRRADVAQLVEHFTVNQ